MQRRRNWEDDTWPLYRRLNRSLSRGKARGEHSRMSREIRCHLLMQGDRTVVLKRPEALKNRILKYCRVGITFLSYIVNWFCNFCFFARQSVLTSFHKSLGLGDKGNPCSSTYNTSATKCGEGLPPHQTLFCWYQLGVLPFNSILTLTAWSYWRPHRLRAQSHKTALVPQMPIASSGSQVTRLLCASATNQGVRVTPVSVSMICYNGSQNPEKHFAMSTGLLQMIFWRIQMNSQMKRYVGWCPEGSHAQGHLSPWSLGICQLKN